MDDGFGTQLDAAKRQRIIERLDQMVESGRVTGQEAERLRAAREPNAFDAVIRDIRVRHAGARLGTAVDDGSLTQEDADGFLEQMTKGEHPRSLRARLRGLHPGQRAGSHLPAGALPEDDVLEDS